MTKKKLLREVLAEPIENVWSRYSYRQGSSIEPFGPVPYDCDPIRIFQLGAGN